MRFRILDNERFVVVQIRALNAPNGQRNALIVTSILAWQETFGDAIKGVFDLSQSEVEIVRCMVEGHTIKSIAAKRGRSEATVRTQIRSIYEKTETRSQAELVRISLSLMDMVKTTGGSEPHSYVPSDGKDILGPNVFQSIPRPSKRWMDYIVYGDLTGAPVLYLPSDLGLIRVPARIESLLKVQGIKMIVPIRAGYGRSTPIETTENYEDLIAADFAALLDHFDIEQCPILAQTSDFCFATLFAARHPERVSAIVTCAPPFPFWKREQFERMDKWYRFILANARFAPRVLPYMVKAGFFLARSIGKRGFLNAVFSNSDADKAVFANQEVFDAMALGSEVTLSHWHSAHVAFACEVTLHAGQNWGNDLAQLEGQIPVTAFIGLDGPMMPQQTFDEIQQKYPWIEYKVMPDAGELLLFKYWPEVLEYLTPFLQRKS
nr:alpha/beta fold hydrolase [Cochlodiniinecator piscidefendens]